MALEKRVADRPKSSSPLGAAAVAALLAYCVAVLWVYTQLTAAAFEYHPALGRPIVGHIYAPWTWALWLFRFYRFAPDRFGWQAFQIGALLLVGFTVYALYIGAFLRRIQEHTGLHGTAHWASEDEIRKTGLLPRRNKSGSGVYVGGWVNGRGEFQYLRHDGPEHIACFAPTRSGKGVSLVIPTLLSWPGSTIVNDIKGELYAATAGWRSSPEGANNIVLRFDPTATEGNARFNPLAEVRWGTEYEAADVQNIVTIIMDHDGKGIESSHWRATAYSLLTGVIVHLHYKMKRYGQEVTLPAVALAFSDPQRPSIDTLWAEMRFNDHLKRFPHPSYPSDQIGHPVVFGAGTDMINTPDKERGSILSTARTALALYRDPVVAQNISASDWKIGDLMDHERPVSLYLVTPPGDIPRLKPLTRMMMTQFIRVLTSTKIEFVGGKAVQPHKHRLLFMFDEFASQGKLEYVAQSLSFVAGYGIKMYLILQDYDQLTDKDLYGQSETITSNCHVRIAYAANKPATAKWISEQCGTTTVITEKISTSGARFAAIQKGVSRSYAETARKLITPDEVMRLAQTEVDEQGQVIPGEVLVMVAGAAPIKGRQSLYYRDAVFMERVKIPAPPTGRVRDGGRGTIELINEDGEVLEAPAENRDGERFVL